MSDSELNLDELESAAKTASWASDFEWDESYVYYADDENVRVFTPLEPSGFSRHFATANPGTVLAMIARIRELEAKLAAAEELAGAWKLAAYDADGKRRICLGREASACMGLYDTSTLPLIKLAEEAGQ